MGASCKSILCDRSMKGMATMPFIAVLQKPVVICAAESLKIMHSCSVFCSKPIIIRLSAEFCSLLEILCVCKESVDMENLSLEDHD